MGSQLKDYAKQNGIRYFLVSFTDLAGVTRSKLMPASVADMAQHDGAGFAGFAAHLNMSPADADIFGIPDVARAIQLPWKKDVAWLPADLHMHGEPLPQAPRNVLQRVAADAKKAGYVFKTGVECEYFLLDGAGEEIADRADFQDKPCYDQQALMRRYDLISTICDYMQDMGWGAYQNDHEDGNGQFEMNWDYDDCLVTADRHVFFKFMVRSLAEAEGMRATFMPKPFSHLTGNGCHMHFSLWDETDNCVFDDPAGELGMSELAYQFLGGVLHHAPAMTAMTNPLVNSFKRINAPVTSSGATWSPNTISYGGNNRTHMLRIPDAGRFELRLSDGAANPYLLPAAVLAAGLDGIKEKRNPGARIDADAYTSNLSKLKKLPASLHEAAGYMQKSKMYRERLGAGFVDDYIACRMEEWHAYVATVSEWERKYSFDV